MKIKPELPGKNWTKALRYIVMYAAVGFVIAAYSVSIYSYVRMQISDDTRINAAGRLRMLTQKVTKELLLYRDGSLPRQSVEKSVSIFHATIYGITRGGSVPLDMTMTMSSKLPAVADPESRRQLERIIREWGPFMDNVVRYLDNKDPASLRCILESNENMIEIIDRTVMTIQDHADSDQRTLGLIIASAILLIIIAIVATIVGQVKRYRSAEMRLAEIEQLLPICSSCKKIRTDNDHPEDPQSWTSIDEYLREKKDMVFTHGICPDCMKRLYPDMFGDEPKKG
jgi:hypothetical protein